MNLLHLVAFLLVGAAGTAVVLTRNPKRQAIVFSFYGLLLSILFFVLQAPDVAFSELVVGGGVIPLMLLVTISKIERGHR